MGGSGPSRFVIAGAEADTWGISGPAFLGIYVALLVVAVGLALAVRDRAWMWQTLLPSLMVLLLPRLARRWPSRGPVRQEVRAPDLASVELAYLTGEVDHATFVAVMRLEELGAIELRRLLKLDQPIREQLEAARQAGRVTVTGASTGPLHPVESAVLRHLEDGRRGVSLYPLMRVDPVVKAMHRDMTSKGFLVGAARGWLIRLGAVPLGAVTMPGLLRLRAGVANQKPVLLLVMLLIASVIALYFSLKAPRLTAAGHAVVDEYKQEHSDAVEEMRAVASETPLNENVAAGFWQERGIDARAVAAMGTVGMVTVGLRTDSFTGLLPEISSSDLQPYADPQDGFVMGPFGFSGGGGGGGGCGG